MFIIGSVKINGWLHLIFLFLISNLGENQIVMESNIFRSFINNISSIDNSQYEILKNTILQIGNKDPIGLILETPIDELKCPYCDTKKKQKWGKRSGLQRYRCITCLKTFNSLTSTPLARLRKKEKWLDYAECLREGYSVRKSAEICEVHYTTCFKWRHMFLEKPRSVKAKELSGIVEADETYFLRSKKGERNLQRKARKRGGKASKRGLSKQQVCVFVSINRKGYVYDKIFETFNSSQLSDNFVGVIKKDALLCSDSLSVYKKSAKDNKIAHGFINSSKGEKVKKNVVHIQNINSYHSCLKRWMGRFNGVATKYLENYISWYRFLNEFKQKISPQIILFRSKNGGEYKHQPLMAT